MVGGKFQYISKNKILGTLGIVIVNVNGRTFLFFTFFSVPQSEQA